MKEALKRSLSVLLAITIIFSSAYVGLSEIDYSGLFAVRAKAASTTEVPEGYIGVYTVDDLYNVRNNLTANYILMNDIDLTEATAEGGEYDFMGNGWNPIGSGDTYSNNAFTGVFDGNGYSVIGMRIEALTVPSSVSSLSYFGLFSENSGTITNLHMKEGTVSGGFGKYNYGGSIAGINTGTITYCSNECLIMIIGSSSYYAYSGGIVGANSGTIECCYNLGDVKHYNNKAGHYLGGIVGSNTSIIKNCYNVGEVVSTLYASGISGSNSNSGNIINCYNTGFVSGDNGSYSISEGNGVIDNCYYNENSTTSTGMGATLLSNEKMKDEISFVGFDFADTWAFFDDSYLYPQLKDNPQCSTSFDEIQISSLPNKTEIDRFDKLDLTGCKINCISNGEIVSTKNVTVGMVSGYDTSKEGKQIVDVSYGGRKTSFEIEVGYYGYTPIYTTDDLYNVRYNLNGKYILMNDIDLTEDTAIDGVYDFMDNGWNPIGSGNIYTNNDFCGFFEGNGYSIKGLRIDVTSVPSGTDLCYLGLFSSVSGTVADLSIYGSINSNANQTYAGSVTALLNGGSIINCHSFCEINMEDGTITYVGGLAGSMRSSSYIALSSNNRDISGRFVGGIVGDASSLVSFTIEECYNSGNIYSNGQYCSGTCGGILGFCRAARRFGEIKNCYNAGAISEEISAGIVVNDSSSNIKLYNCYNVGMVAGASNTYTSAIAYEIEPVNCYYLEGCGPSQAGATAYNESMLQKELSYSGFDFENIWIIDTTLDYKFPQLRRLICKNNHMYSWNYEIEPTCSREGRGTRTCVSCGISDYFEVIPMLEHVPSDWIVSRMPTSTVRGVKVKKCELCKSVVETELTPLCPDGYTPVFTVTDLYLIKEDLTANYILMNDLDLSEATSPKGSFSFMGYGWEPIGGNNIYGNEVFSGIFDGNGFTITGMSIDVGKPTDITSSVNIGLFSNVSGEIKNLTMSNCVIESEIVMPKNYELRVGIIAATNTGIIKNCFIENSKIVVDEGFRYVRAGGVAGVNNGSISLCSFSGNIDIYAYDVEADGDVTSFAYAGGISGLNTNGSIGKCFNIGDISAYAEGQWGMNSVGNFWSDPGVYHSGGITGINGTIINCYNRGKISSAGIASQADSITNCYSVGKAESALSDSAVVNSYYLKGAGSSCEGAVEYTDYQMQQKVLYKGFDFVNTWYINTDSDYPYPQLRLSIAEECVHEYSGWYTDKDPTCVETGIKHKSCVFCGELIIEDISPLGHDIILSDWVIDIDATCNGAGVKYHKCSRCNDKVDITIIPPTGHSYNEWNVDVEASCTTAGSQSSVCAVCGDVQTEEITPYGHTYSTRWTIDKAATCTEAGSKSHHCLRCGDKTDVTEIVATGHNFTDWLIDTPPTCTGTGANYRACLDCGIEELHDVSAKGHTTGKWIIEYEPTCTAEGSKYQLCSECDAKIYEAIAALGHEYEDGWTIDVEATCTESGSKSHHCIRCVDKADITEIGALGHTYSEIWSVDVEATCTEDGSKSHHCLRCEDKVDVTTIEATGHSYGTWLLQTAPTCTEQGVKYRVCASCDNTETALMNSLGHEYSTVWTVDTSATCTENGLKSHHCTRCEDKKDITLISATGHFFGAWNVEKEATCTETGLRSRNCELCSTVENDETEAYGHEYSTQWTIDTEPTCSAVGSKSHHCLRCDDRTDIEEIPFGGHIFGKWYVVTEPTMDEAGVRAHKCYNCEMTEEAELPKLLKYTATFVADGDVVATVDFPEDATEIEIPEVPHKDKFNGEWENFDVRNKNFTVNAVYAPIPTEQIDGITAGNKTDYYSSTGEVEINLNVSAPSKTIVTTTTKAVPLDIIFVLDQSGSMADGGKKNALKNAVTSFSNEILADAITNSVDHRIAVVGFASGSNNSLNYQNTELLTADVVKYNKITNADYKNALVSVNDNGALNEVIADAVNAIDAEGATRADLGLEMATNIFANNPITDNRQRVVVFLTDGEPTSYNGFEYSVANVAIQNAYQLKNTYDATVYSVGVFDNADSKVSNFMNYVSSNYNEEVVMKKSSKETAENTNGYYIDVTDVSSLSDVFTSIVEETTTHTGRFTNATLKYTLTKYFTLTSLQEEAIRKNAIENLGVTNDQISITRNADGTTTIVINGVEPWEDGEAFVIDFTFRATANGNTLKSGTYQVGTFESGVILENGEGYEAVFAPNSVDIGGTSGIAVFNINNIPFAINRLSSTTKVVAPATDFGADYNFIGWNVPANLTLNNEVRVFEAELLKNEYKISWNIDGEIIEAIYAVGDFINIPEVGNNSIGGAFAGWDMDIPETMPSENLTITAIYDAHYHKYDVIKDFENCTEGGTLTYTCECGDSYTEKIESCEHSFEVITASNNQNAIENAGSRCTVCGIKDSKALRLEGKDVYQESDASYNTAKVELDYVDENGEKYQPDGDIEISVQLDDVFEGEIPEDANASVYRVNDDGSRTKLECEQDGMNMKFKTDHFSTYEFEFTTGEQKYLFAENGAKIDYSKKLIFSSAYATTNIKDIATYLAPGIIADISNNAGYFATGSSFNFVKDTTTENYKIIINGDLNGDGVCNVLDAMYAERVSSGHVEATEDEIYAANGCVSDELDVSSYQNVVNMALAS